MPMTKVAFGDPLTEKERRVLELTAQGHVCTRTATILGLKESTVRTYRKRIQAKLGATCAANAVYLGFVEGYLNTGQPAGGGAR